MKTGKIEDWKERDALERSQFVQKLIRQIEKIDPKHGLAEAHGTIVLDGAYGTGKTFLLNWVAAELKEKSDYVVVNFDA